MSTKSKPWKKPRKRITCSREDVLGTARPKKTKRKRGSARERGTR